MSTWADAKGPTPGNSGSVRMQKSIAMGMAAPASPRKVHVELKGSKTGCAKVPGLTNR